MPSWLSTGAMAFWDRFVSELQEIGVLATANLLALALLSEAYSEVIEWSQVIEEDGRRYQWRPPAAPSWCARAQKL